MAKQPTCGFCGRPRNEVKALIAAGDDGPNICNKCIDAAQKAVAERTKGQPTEAAKDEPLRKPKEIRAFLDEYVIGQDKAKMDVAVAVYNHFKRREAMRRGGLPNDVEIEKSNILMMGPSGTGKTHLARTVAKLLKVPFYVADATRLTQAGYVGDDVESLLQGLLADADGDVERAQWGIIFLDEFDKMARKSGRGASGYRDVSGEGVQQSLLKMVEGGRVQIPRGMGTRVVSSAGQPADMIDTSNILFICAGSFAGIEEVVNQRLNKNASMGFSTSLGRKLDKREVYLEAKEEDILDFGIIPELVGRLPVHTTTLPLTEDEMVRVLVEPKNSLVKQFTALFDMDGIELRFDEGALRAIGRKASERPTGARALRGIVEDILRTYSYESPSDPTVGVIRVTELAVEGGEAVITRKDPEAKLEPTEPVLMAAKG